MIEAIAFALALVLFLPLGMNLAVATGIEAVFLALFLVYRGRPSNFARPEVLVFMFIVVLNIALSMAFHPEFSFQIVRSALGPVAFMLVATRLSQGGPLHDFWSPLQTKILLGAIVSVGVIAVINPGGWLPQNVSILLEADASSAERKFILPHTAFNIIFPLFVLGGRWLPALACLIVILAAGSRGALVTAVVVVAVFLVRQKGRAVIPLVLVATSFIGLAVIFPAAFDRLQTQSVFEDYTRFEEIAAATTAAWTPAHILTGLPFTFPYWEGYAAFTSFADEQERVFTNSMFDVHNGFVFVLLRFGIIGAGCVIIALARFWRSSPELRPVLLSFLLLWLTSAGPISAIDGSFALALAALFIPRRQLALPAPRAAARDQRGARA